MPWREWAERVASAAMCYLFNAVDIPELREHFVK